MKIGKIISIILMTVTALVLASAVAFAEEDVQNETDPSENLQPGNGIPLVIVRVDESETTIDEMNNSFQHSVRCESATVEIKVPENFSGDSLQETELDYVRGRGNSTWSYSQKKPYKIQLSKSQDLFGMGASEDWALLANSFDSSLIRNRITNWLGEEMGLEFTPQQVPVDLIMVGSESGIHKYGSYCLCETIKVEKSRINIDKLKKKDTENITGGYLMATYSMQGEDEPESTRFTTKYGVEFMNDTPEYVADEGGTLTEAQLAQRSYIQAYMQELEDLIMAPGDIDAARHEQIAARMDLTSAADYWLLQELSFNTDAYATTSTYLYKKRDGKLYWGPLWDFDYAWGNATGDRPVTSFNNTSMLWIDQLRDKDPQFVSLLKTRWEILNEKLQELTETEGIIDQYRDEVSSSQQVDYAIWSEIVDERDKYSGTAEYDEAIEKLRRWIDTRRAWMDENKADIGTCFYTVTYEADGQVIATERVRDDGYAVMDPDAPVSEGFVFACWMNDKGKTPDKVHITEDTTFAAHYVKEGEAIEPEELYIDLPEEMTVEYSSGFFPVIDREGYTLDTFKFVEPYDATNQHVTWTSSNEKVATIDIVNKRVVLKAGGDTTITGTLYNDVSASFVLHVNGPEPEPEPEPDKVSIQDAKVVLSSTALTYNKKVQKPSIKTVGGKALQEGTDYTAEWSNTSSKNAGTYTVTVTGIGQYTGIAKATYKINKAANTMKVKGKKARVKYKKLRKKTRTLAVSKVIKFQKKGQGAKTYKLISAKKGKKSFKKKFKINAKTGKVKIQKKLKKGTYKVKVKVKASGNANYKASAWKTVTFKVRIK